MKRRIASNIASHYGTRVLSIVLAFFLVPFLIGRIGIEAFGVIALFESLIQFMDTVFQSLRVAMSRYATFSLSRNDREGFISYLSTGRTCLIGLAAVVFISGVWAVPYVSGLFRVPDLFESQSKQMLIWMVAASAAILPNMVYWSGLYAKQRFDLLNACRSGAILVRTFSIFTLFLLLPPSLAGLPLYGAIYAATAITENVLVYVIYRMQLKGYSLSLRIFDRHKLHDILHFGFFTTVSHVSSASHENFIHVFINAFWGPAANAMYAVGVKLTNVLESVFKEPIWTLTPTFTDLAARHERLQLKELVIFFTKLTAAISLPLALGLFVYSEWIMQTWMGPGYEAAALVLAWSVLGSMISVPTAVCENLPNAFGRIRIPGVINVAATALSIGAAYAGAHFFSWGLTAFAAGPALVTIVYTVFYLVPYTCSIAQNSVREFWLNGFFRAAVPAVFYWGAVWLGLRTAGFFPLDWVTLALLVPVTWIYCRLCFIRVLTESERVAVRLEWRKRFGGVAA